MAGNNPILSFPDDPLLMKQSKYAASAYPPHRIGDTWSHACNFTRRLLAMAGLSFSLLATIVCTAVLTYIILVRFDAYSADGRTVAHVHAAQHRGSKGVQDSGIAALQRTVQARGSNHQYVFLPARWPLPDIPVALYHPENGSCVLHESVCKNMAAHFNNEDVHTRDILASALMKCVFKPDGCRAADIGGNVGMMTYTMLTLGANVTTIEPQVDLADVIRRTGELNGWSNRLKVYWGGVGWQPGKETLKLNMSDRFLYRIGGNNRHDIITVPLYNVTDILQPGHFDFVKIDTDSLDCPILADVLSLIQSSRISVDSLILETFEGHCRNGYLAKLLAEFQKLGYTVYRTLLWERHFYLPTPLAIGTMPPYATEMFDLRFARYLWKLAPMNEQQWAELVNKRIWQLFLSREDLRSTHMTINERT